jgi:hypothetical protein
VRCLISYTYVASWLGVYWGFWALVRIPQHCTAARCESPCLKWRSFQHAALDARASSSNACACVMCVCCSTHKVGTVLRLRGKDYSHVLLLAGWLWFSSLIRLIIYSFLLWPGFALMALFYFFSTRVRRDIWYGRQVCVGSLLVASVARLHIAPLVRTFSAGPKMSSHREMLSLRCRQVRQECNTS